MAFPSKQILLLAFNLFIFLSFINLSSSTRPPFNPNRPLKSSPDLHDLLPLYNLPKGLLPDNIKSYKLFTDHTFTIKLTNQCYVKFNGQLVHYDKTIKGKLGDGTVSDVSSIQAKKIFIWVSGFEVDGDAGMIEFHAGAFSQKMPAQAFQTIPTCLNKGCQDSQLDASSI